MLTFTLYHGVNRLVLNDEFRLGRLLLTNDFRLHGLELLATGTLEVVLVAVDALRAR